MNTTDKWVSISTYAREWGVDRSTVYKWLDAGILQHYRVRESNTLVVRIWNMRPDLHISSTTASEAVGGR